MIEKRLFFGFPRGGEEDLNFLYERRDTELTNSTTRR